jgi:hypothetical protein
MLNLHEEIRTRAGLLDVIDRRRFETGNSGLGLTIERAIVNECLAELEAEIEASQVLVATRSASRYHQ